MISTNLIVFVIVVNALILVVAVALTREWYGARVARRQGFLVGALIGVILLGTLVLRLVLVKEWRTQLWVAFQISFGLFACVMIALTIIRRRSAGALLLSLGRVRGHQFLLAAAAISLVSSLSILFLNSLDHGFGIQQFAELLFRLSFGGVLLLIGLSNVELRERGVFSQGLTPWHKMHGFHWERDKPDILTLQIDARSPLGRELPLSVPAQQRRAVEAILAQRIAPAPTISDSPTT